jgi:hemolysin activation/secretion protein
MFPNLLSPKIRNLIATFVILLLHHKSVLAQTIPPNLPKVPNPTPPEKPFELPQIKPPNNPLKNLPAPLPNLPEIQGDTKIRVKSFHIIGNSSIQTKALQKLIARFINREMTLTELLEARSEITRYYTQHGFVSSRAFILIQDNPGEISQNNAIINIRCLEGVLESVNILGAKHQASFIKDRLKYKSFPVLNQLELEEAIRLLQRDYPLKSISGGFSAGSEPQNSVLNIEVKPKKPISVAAQISNDAPESVGTLRQSLSLNATSLLGVGERFDVGGSRTDGSDSLFTSFLVPLNRSNGKFSFEYDTYANRIIQKPYDQLNITSATQDWTVRFRQPILRTDNGKFFREVAVEVSIAREENQTSLDGVAFQLSQGADLLGRTKSTTLSLVADYSFQSSQQFLGLRSELRIGLPIGATLSPAPPDGEFYRLNSNVLWGRQLSNRVLFVAGANLQLADRSLIQFQQFGFGGIDSLPGYPTNSIYSDNGFLGKVELHYLAYSGSGGRLQLIPFFAFGVPWNNKQETTYTPPSILASTGIGVQYTFSDWLNARLDWGIPIFDISNFSQTLQSQGLVLTLGVTF